MPRQRHVTRTPLHAGRVLNDPIHIRVCPQCQQRFEILLVEEWAYREKRLKNRDKVKLFCSWHCLRAWEQNHQPQQGKLRKSTKQERDKEIYWRYLAGETAPELGKEYGINASSIRKIVETVANWLAEEEAYGTSD